MTLRFVDFAGLTAGQRADAARVLRDAFAHMPDAFDGEFDAEVDSFFDDEDREAFAAFDGETLLGWIGRIETYDHAWECTPLSSIRRISGAALTRELETRVKNQGVLTLYLGTDDDFGGTSLFGADLFPDVARNIPGVRQVGRGHPFAFYQRLGYEIVGLIPDANGPGKPDIWMAKRL